MLLASAVLLFNPGLVGLGILEGFTAGLALVTTDCGVHSPEISYLRHGTNGLMTPPDSKNFARAVIDILSNDALAAILRAGAAQSAEDYNMSAMVGRFCDGVQRWRASSRLGETGGER